MQNQNSELSKELSAYALEVNARIGNLLSTQSETLDKLEAISTTITDLASQILPHLSANECDELVATVKNAIDTYSEGLTKFNTLLEFAKWNHEKSACYVRSRNLSANVE